MDSFPIPAAARRSESANSEPPLPAARRARPSLARVQRALDAARSSMAESRPWTALALALVLAFALATRVTRASEGLPYLHGHDEPVVAGRALEMLKTGDFDPGWYRYGTFGIYLNAGVDFLHYLWLARTPDGAPPLDTIHTQFDTTWGWTISHPSFYLWNRCASALIGTIGVALTFALTRRFAGRAAALLAAALLAVVEPHVEFSAFIGPDVPAATMGLGAVFLAVRAVQDERGRDLVWSAALAGLATATKYNAVCVLLAPVVATWMMPGRSIEARAWRSLGLPILALLVFFAAMPYALIDLPRFATHLAAELHHYQVAGHGAYSVAPGWEHFTSELASFREHLGLAGLVAGLVGWLMLSRTRLGRLMLVGPLAFGALMINTRVDFHRGFVSLYPYLCVGIAVCTNGLSRRVHLARRVRVRRLATALAITAVVALQVSSLRVSYAAATQIETRSRAIAAINRLARERALTRIGIAHDLRLHRQDLARLRVPYDVVHTKRLAALAREGRFDALLVACDYESYVVAGSPEIEDTVAAERREWKARLPRGTRILRIDGAPIRHWRPTVDPGLELIAIETSGANAR